MDSTDVYRAPLAELLEAEPEENPDVAIAQSVSEVRGVTFEEGFATVDRERSVLAFEATDQEKVLAWSGILMTLGQCPEVETVAFTV